MSLSNRKTPRQIRPKDLVGDLTADGEDLGAILHNRSASQAPAGGDNFASGYAIGSHWIYGDRVYVSTGDGVWVEQRTKAESVPIPDVTGLTTALAGKQDTSEKGAANGYASLDSGGKVPAAQLPDVGGGANWGGIGGTLSDQADLQAALNGKAASSHAHSASDITSGALPISRGGTASTTAANARNSLDVPSRASVYSGSLTRYLWFSTTSGASPQYRTNIYAAGSTLNADSFSSPSASSSSAYFSDSLGMVVLGPGVFLNTGFLNTSGGLIDTGGGLIDTFGGNINVRSGNVSGTSGSQIGWTSSANSPTGSGTNCHINANGKLVRQTSQGKLKSEQAPLQTTIDEIMAWQPKSFRWVEEMGGHEDIGLIAEEVSAIDPRAAWCDHDQVLQSHEEPSDPADPDSETVEVQRYQCCPEQPVVPLGVHYERAWVHLLAATQDFYRRYQEERAELLARIEALEGAQGG